MLRIRLSVFLLSCGIIGSALGLFLADAWRPRVRSLHEDCGAWFSREGYVVTWGTQWQPFGRERLVCIRVRTWEAHDSSDWETNPRGVFFRGERATPGTVYVVQGDQLHLIPLDQDDFDALEQVASDWLKMPGIPRGLTPPEDARWRAERDKFRPGNSTVWKTKVEPQILKLIDERNRAREGARREMQTRDSR